MQYKCYFCGSSFQLPESPKNFTCPQCDSYFNFSGSNGDLQIYNAYPAKDLKKYYEFKRILLKF